MLAPDVNVLVYAHRVESPDHGRYGEWLRRLATGAEPFALSDLVCAGFVRVVTNPRLWRPATEPATALTFVDHLRRRRACRLLAPGSGTWTIFSRLVDAAAARGKLVADAYLAALAIENGCTLATCDGDFARFAELRWVHPLQPSG
jgi:toxin-antitoxin system PIN domain toxin